jgi:integrase
MERSRAPGQLTQAAIDKSKPKEIKYKLFDGGGLFLEVMPSGNKYWKYRYRTNDKDTCVTLGKHGTSIGDISSDTARNMAVEARKLRNIGGEPAKKFSKSYVPPQDSQFSSVFANWVDYEMKNRTWTEDTKNKLVARFDNYILPEIGVIPIEALSAKEFRFILDKLVALDKKFIANRLFTHSKRVFDHAVIEELIKTNPLNQLSNRYKEPKSKPLARVEKTELQSYLIKLDNDYRCKPVTKCALKLIHLTFLRCSELRNAKWTDINFDTRIWEVPGLTMKNGEDFIVPLSDQAIEVLEELKSINPQSKLVFPGFTNNTIKPISAEALLSAIKRLGFDATKHGFRQIASTALNEAGFRPDAIECQLDHHKQGVRAIYNRAQYLDERADMMQWLADTYDAVKRGELTI